MKKNAALCVLLSFAFFAFSQIPEPHFLSLAVDGAYYPLSSPKPTGIGSASFAPVTGFFYGAELRATLSYKYRLSVPLGTHPLFSTGNIEFGGGFELSPVSAEPFVSLTYTPLPFLVLAGGAACGTGWNFSPLKVRGLAFFESATHPQSSYKTPPLFTKARVRLWLQGTFQFDLAALIPGEWNHAVLLASYKFSYDAVPGAGNRPWLWQDRAATAEERVNGPNYYAAVILGYQMPLVLQTVGVQAEFWGYYADSSFPAQFAGTNPSFTRITVAPVFNIQLAKKQSLLIQFRFASRRAFNKQHSAYDSVFSLADSDPSFAYVGREWFFERIAFSYNIRF